MENGYHSFARNFQECCHASSTRLAYERGKTDPKCAAAAQEYSALYNAIGEKLGEEHRLIDEFDSVKNYMQGFDAEWIYQQGFQDCVTLLRWLGML